MDGRVREKSSLKNIFSIHSCWLAL